MRGIESGGEDPRTLGNEGDAEGEDLRHDRNPSEVEFHEKI